MAVGRIRNQPRTPRPSADRPADEPVVQPGDGVLRPGQHVVVPRGTGLAHFHDHWDARPLPEYGKYLRGEAADPTSPGDPASGAEDQQGEPQPDDEGEAPLDPDRPRRQVDVRGGLFTLDEGSLDAAGHPLCTLEAFLDGEVSFISCAVRLAEIPYGTPIRLPELERALGRPLRMMAAHESPGTAGGGAMEVCVSEPTAFLRETLEHRLAIEVG